MADLAVPCMFPWPFRLLNKYIQFVLDFNFIIESAKRAAVYQQWRGLETFGKTSPKHAPK